MRTTTLELDAKADEGIWAVQELPPHEGRLFFKAAGICSDVGPDGAFNAEFFDYPEGFVQVQLADGRRADWITLKVGMGITIPCELKAFPIKVRYQTQQDGIVQFLQSSERDVEIERLA